MRRDDRSPETYRASVEGKQRELLEAVRAVIREVAPDGSETIKYGMLHFPGVACLAAQKHHVSLYVSPDVLSRHADAFSGVDHGKSCLRFRRLDQVDPEALRKLLTDESIGGTRT